MFLSLKRQKKQLLNFTKCCNSCLILTTIKMETQKIANVLGDADSEYLQQENGMLPMIKITQTMVKEMKIVQPLNLKPKTLNQIFVII